jgi:N-dimethylarginine dimethylaminohydrolase
MKKMTMMAITMFLFMFNCRVLVGSTPIPPARMPLVLPEGAIRPPSPTIIPDTEGMIRHILIQAPGLLMMTDGSWWSHSFDMYKSLFIHLNPDVKITVIASNPEQANWLEHTICEVWEVTNPLDVIPYSDTGGGYSYGWSRDGRLILQYLDGTIAVIQPERTIRGDSSSISDILCMNYPDLVTDVQTTRLYFEGGDIVVDGEHVFLGYNTVEYNMGSLGLSENEVVALFQDMLGKEVVVIGSRDIRPPYGHVDMYLTPVGDNTVLLGDPSLCSYIIQGWTEEERREHLFDIAGRMFEYFITVNFNMFDILLNYNLSSEISGGLDWIEVQLKEMGFNVVRVPLLIPPSRGLGDLQTIPFITYNNVLLENHEGGKIVYMPVYGIGPFDELARQVYEGQGFAVRGIDGALPLSASGGVVRCQANVLLRGY